MGVRGDAPPTPIRRQAAARPAQSRIGLRREQLRTPAEQVLIRVTTSHEIPTKSGGENHVGGCGSGGWNRSARSTIEDLRRIDVHKLLRDRVLNGPCSVTVSWSRGRERVASIGIFGGHDKIHMHYRQQSPGEREWRQVAQDIWIDWRPNRYGGTTPYFRCPHCRRSVWHIYLVGGHNVCRHCARLTYGSRRSRSYDRLAETVHRLRLKLGGDPGFDSPIAPRPKGMHRKTYDRLCNRIHACESASWDRAAAWLGRLEARIGKGRKAGRGSFWT